MTPATLTATITRLCTMWPYRAKTTEDVRALTVLYWSALSDLTDDELADATSQAISTCDEFPSAGTLRALARPPRTPDLDRDPIGHMRRAGLLALPESVLTDQAMAAAYARLEATKAERQQAEPTPSSRTARLEAVRAKRERMERYGGKQAADAVLRGFPVPGVKLGTRPDERPRCRTR